MRTIALTAALLLTPLALGSTVGCDTFSGLTNPRERVQRQLVRARQQRTRLVDELWAEYGGGDMSNAVNNAEAPTDNTDPAGIFRAGLQAIQGAVAQTDRAVFEAHLAVLGEGERPAALSQRARDFYERADVQERALRLAELQRDIERLEARLREIGDRTEPVRVG